MKACWTFEVKDVTSPIDAALESFFVMQTHGTPATHCVVHHDEGRETKVDLEAYWAQPLGLEVAKARAQRHTQYFVIAAIEGSREPCHVRGPYESASALDVALQAMRQHFVPPARYLILELNALEIIVRPAQMGHLPGYSSPAPAPDSSAG
jgi:hypothetical protein